MFSNREERSELLDALVISYKDINIPKFSQVNFHNFDASTLFFFFFMGDTKTLAMFYVPKHIIN